MDDRFGSTSDDICLSISKVSELRGITPSNLRSFEEEGILEVPRNGADHRIYHREEMLDLLGLMYLKKSGMEFKKVKSPERRFTTFRCMRWYSF
ncbi:MerR family transcriptional regulator [Akkermansia sp.]|uniref:MerR family transcriptional regulator n=1 Tax=Akkermansia sp. TaxID=1872421 RepID=UPI003AB58A5B